eukprot:CCRYP_020081-RA/>CCRYP_020081-RA protein AED:0.47 eAED:0.50 QI:0/-1/0/1/-1/1/1/0/136
MTITPLAFRRVFRILAFIILATTSCLVFIHSEAMSRHKQTKRSRPERLEDESSVDRYKKAFWWVASFIFIAISPLVFRFLHVMTTDPAVPLIWKEIKVRGRRLLSAKFGSFSVQKSSDELEHEETSSKDAQHTHVD